MSHEEIYDGSPVLLLLVGESMELVYRSPAMETLLRGRQARALHDILDHGCAADLAELSGAMPPGQPAVSRMLKMHRHDGAELLFPCLVDKTWERAGEGGNARALLRITALYDPEGQRAIAELAKSERLLRDLIETASEAMWCIEFSESIDLAAGTQEIVRQVFANECRWLACNKAMARLYVPEGVDFEKQAVSLYFQHSAANEAFVGQIIESGFCIDNALSVDVRHDGSTIYVENTVRAHIHDGRLLRLLGTVRDVTGYRQTQNRLQRQIENVHSVLGAIPYALLVIDRRRTLLGANPAFESTFGWSAQQLLGRDIQCLIDIENALPGGRQWYGCDRQQWVAKVRTQSGAALLCAAVISPVGEEAPDRFVLTLSPVPADASRAAHPAENAP